MVRLNASVSVDIATAFVRITCTIERFWKSDIFVLVLLYIPVGTYKSNKVIMDYSP